MKVKLPLMIQDAVSAEIKGLRHLVEFKEFDNEPFFIAGPVTERVAILDFDPNSGQLRPGVPFSKPVGRSRGTYEVTVPQSQEPPSPDFISVNVLATILRTLEIAEDESALGRKVTWAFDAPQLLVIPRAGEAANAYYHRDTHSLQFFYFRAPDGRTIYTALSRDIIAHETAHAILDAIAPDLLNAFTPESLALHEAFADLVAAFMSMDSQTLVEAVMEQTGGDLEAFSTAFNQVAEELGKERYARHGLRDLLEFVTLGQVVTGEPHELSLVLSSALYKVFMKTFEIRLKELVVEEGHKYQNPRFSLSGRAVFEAAHQLSRTCFRALDYLPPGEVSFRDFGRAFIAADKVSFPDDKYEFYRDFLRQAFQKRGIIQAAEELDTPVNFFLELEKPINLNDLVESDWVAYEFANRPEVRSLLGIPDEVMSFTVHKRLRTTKHYVSTPQPQEDIVFNVSWDFIEDNNVGNGLPKRRSVRAGTTLVLDANPSEEDVFMQPEFEVLENEAGGYHEGLSKLERGDRLWADRLQVGTSLGDEDIFGNVGQPEDAALMQSQAGYNEGLSDLVGYGRPKVVRRGKEKLRVRACLTSERDQSQQRDAMIRHLVRQGLVHVADAGPAGMDAATGVVGHIRNDVLSLSHTGHLLHITPT